MTLLNVRLDEHDAHRAKALREAGVVLSELVREAIRAEYARRVGPGGARRRPSRVVADIIAAIPDDPDDGGAASGAPVPVDTTDRRAVQRYVAARLRR